MWKIENAQELSNFINLLKADENIDLEKVELTFLKQVKIKIKGDPHRYNGTINYAICKAICEFQNEIWRTYAEIKTGIPHITQLTQEEKNALEIIFTVNEGCTEIIADLTDMFKEMRKFFKGITNGMTGKQKVFTYTAFAICASSAFVAHSWIEADKEIKVAQTHSSDTQAQKQHETQQLNSVLTTIKDVANNSNTPRFKQSLQSIEEHTEKAYCEVVSSVSDAENVTIYQGNDTTIKLDQPKLQQIASELNAQEKAKTKPETLDLYIDGVKRQEGKITIFAKTLQGETFTANIDPDMLEDKGVNEIIDRIKDINTIKLYGMVKRRANKIEQATFTTIITEE